MLSRILKFVTLSMVLSMGALQALAATLYGTIGAGGGASTLVTIDPTSGALVSTIGSVGYAVNGMTVDPTTGTLYATTSNRDATFPDGLITINTTTGAGTPVGTGAGQYVNVPSANSSGQLFGWTEDSDDLVLWNKTAGTVTVPGDSTMNTYEGGMAFDNNNVLYYLNGNENLYTINTSTGVGTSVGSVTGVTTGYAHHMTINPENGLMYAISQTNDSGTPNPRSIYTIDIATLAVVSTLPTVDNLHTIAFVRSAQVSTAPTAIPTLSEWGMIILSSLIAIGAILTLRRQRM